MDYIEFIQNNIKKLDKKKLKMIRLSNQKSLKQNGSLIILERNKKLISRLNTKIRMKNILMMMKIDFLKNKLINLKFNY